jgi:hypothetical protein
MLGGPFDIHVERCLKVKINFVELKAVHNMIDECPFSGGEID